MPYCYYTCNLIPFEIVARNGFTARWLGDHVRGPVTQTRRDALSVHPMTCPYVTKLVAAADQLLAGADAAATAPGAEPRAAHTADCIVVPGGCDAARRMGDLLAAAYPDRVFVLPMPRSAVPEVTETLAADLCRLDEWLSARLPDGAARPAADPGSGPHVDYPAEPRPGGVFVVAGPLTDDSLLQLISRLGAHVSGLESCTSPDRWRLLAAGTAPSRPEGAAGVTPPGAAPAAADHVHLAARLLEIGMCPRRSTTARRDYLNRRFDAARPTSIIYARQSFCDPGAYDSLLVAQLAAERGLPYLEIEVDFPFDANGPLRTRVEAFLEAQLLDDDLLADLDDDLVAVLDDDDLFGGGPGEDDLLATSGGHGAGGEG